MLPQTWTQVLIVLAMILPGFVYQIVRRRAAGPSPDHAVLAIRMFRALAGSVVFIAIYAIVAGPSLVHAAENVDDLKVSVRLWGLVFLVLVIFVPSISALLLFYITETSRWKHLRGWTVQRFRLEKQWNPTPSAWDFVFNTADPGWVRIRTPHGWIGGWFGHRSYASAHPDPQELFLEVGFVMKDDGTFSGEESAPGGVFVNCKDVLYVDFIPADGDDGNREEQS